MPSEKSCLLQFHHWDSILFFFSQLFKKLVRHDIEQKNSADFRAFLQKEAVADDTMTLRGAEFNEWLRK